MTQPGSASTDEAEVLITRVFQAPRDLVFAFWTQPEHLAQWFGPVGYHIPPEDVTIELQVGGRFELRMVETATGRGHWLYGRVVELAAPEMLVIAMDVPHPNGLPPVKATLRVQFHDHGEKTVIRLHQGPFVTGAQRDETIAGWGQSFEKLDAILIG